MLRTALQLVSRSRPVTRSRPQAIRSPETRPPLTCSPLTCSPLTWPAFWLASFLLISIPESNCTPLAAQAPLSDPAPADVDSVDANTGSPTALAPATPSPAQAQIEKIRQAIAEAESFAEKTRSLRADIDSVPSKIKLAREELAGPEAIEVSATVQGVEELSTILADLQARLQNATAASAALAQRPAEVQKRLLEIPSELSDAQQQLSELSDRLANLRTDRATDQDDPAGELRLTPEELLSLDPADATEEELQAAILQTRQKKQQSRVEKLQTERDYYKATAGITPLQQAVLDRQLRLLRSQIERTSAEIDQKKRMEVARQNDRLQDAVSEVPPSLTKLAQANVDLSDLHQKWTARQSGIRDLTTDLDEVNAQVQLDLETARTRINSVGLTDALGLMLRRRREQNLVLRYKFQPQSDLRDTIADYQVRLFELQDEQSELAETGISPVPPADVSKPINWRSLDEAKASEILIGRRRTLIMDAMQTLELLITSTLDADTRRRELLVTIDQYADFVDGHLFWIRSAPAAGRADLTELDEATKWVLRGENWWSVVTHAVNTAMVMPLRCITLLLVVLITVACRGRMRNNIGLAAALPTTQPNASTEAASLGGVSRRPVTFAQTMASMVWTAAAASVWPVCFGAAAILFFSIPSGDPMVRGVALGLTVTTLYLASRELLKESCRDGGLGDAHFGWSSTVRKLVRRNLVWYTAIGGATLFLLAIYHEHPVATLRTIGTRWTSILLFVLTAIFNHFLLRPRSAVYEQISRRHPDSSWVRFRRPVWVVATVVPILFAGLSLGGYLETAFQLGRSLQLTFLFVVFLIIVAGMIDRLLRLRRRDELLAERSRLAAAAQASVDASATDPDGQPLNAAVGDIPVIDESIDFETLDYQSRQMASLLVGSLTVAGLALIWKDVFPAVAFMDSLEIYSVTIDEEKELYASVSLLSVVVTILIGGLLYYAIRNLPGLIELVVLRRTSLDAGAKYAITTLLRYVLFIVGTIWLLDRFRIPYTQLGWLLAAASVGLGFGLQEIVANFVSGIILLLERPVRVGDVVTIDGQTGLVSKIQIRSTTVTNWDRKELVIPNKDLITEKLLNWSLSNVVNRLVLNVGVAYGSDPDLVRRLLLDAVSSHPDVLEDPPPMVNLETFGDSSLNFVVRCFLPNLDNRIDVTHSINATIAEMFDQAGVEIPFPQLDVHQR